MILSAYERETIINFNEADKTASVYTYNNSLCRRLDQLAKTRNDITLLRSGDGWREYIVPKKWVKVSPPRSVSEKTKEAARQRMSEYQKQKKEAASVGNIPPDERTDIQME